MAPTATADPKLADKRLPEIIEEIKKRIDMYPSIRNADARARLKEEILTFLALAQAKAAFMR